MDSKKNRTFSERSASSVPWESEERDVAVELRTGLHPLAERQAATSARIEQAAAHAQDTARPSSLREARVVIRQLRDELVLAKEQLRATTTKYETAAGQIKQLTSELILSEQAERQRIAQILHNDLQQQLFGLQMRVELLSHSLSDEQDTHLAKVNTLITQALNITRTLTVELSPPVLMGEDADITATLDWLVLRMAQMHKLRVEVASTCPVRVPSHVNILVLQLVDELLFNVVKHASIDQARVNLIREEDQLIVVVEDDGLGFDLAAEREPKPVKQGGFGLHSVWQRLHLCGGHLDLETAPGQGTRVTFYVPLRNDASGAETPPPDDAAEKPDPAQ